MIYPEVNIAKRLINRLGLVPPVDIHSVTSTYANVEELALPIDSDGISINLKVSGKKPRIIINSSIPWHRKRFTLAHELGHILIPWHFGTIVDVTKISYEHDIYSVTESEANRFAAELLMPTSWINDVIEKKKTPNKIVPYISETADVSSLAATITVINSLSSGYIFAYIDDNGTVLSSGRSTDTIANNHGWGTTIDPENEFPYCKNFWKFSIDNNTYCWWKFPDEVELKVDPTDNDWRSVLDQIVNEINIPLGQQQSYKSSLNGCLAYANSRVRSSQRTVNAIYSACLQRLHSKKEFELLIEHKKFEEFISKKARDFLSKD